MRKIAPFLLITSLIGGLLILTASPVSAASGDITITRASSAVPTSLPNATIVHLARLEKEDAFLVAGRDLDVATGPLHVWKIKGDLTVDTSFTPVNLGASFAPPATADLANNWDCNTFPCFRSELRVNANAGTAVISAVREGLANTANSNRFSAVTSIAVLSLSSGTVVGSVSSINDPDPDSGISGWAAFGNVALGKDACLATVGNEVLGVSLSSTFAQTWSMQIRPDNSILLFVDCRYTRVSQGVFTSYASTVSMVLKPQEGNLVVDTSWGTNGYSINSNDPTKCIEVLPSFTYDTSIKDLASTKIHHIQFIYERPRNTTLTQWQIGAGYTSTNDCDNYEVAPATTAKVMKLNGEALETLTFPTDSGRFFVSQFVIEPNGRWNGINASFNPATRSSTYQMIKILASGKPDTSNGALGIKDLSGLPSTVTIDGQEARMRYGITGVALTANSTLFAGFTSVSNFSGCSPNPADNAGVTTQTFYPYYFDDDKGLLTSYGTNGLGAGFTIKSDSAKRCIGSGDPIVTFVDSKGRPAILTQVEALDSQQAGLLLAVWDAAEGVIGGGDGTGDLGPSSRIDSKVYRTLPATTQVNTALQTLTPKQERTQTMTSNTTRTCVVVGRFVALLGTGACSVSVQDKRSGTTVRTLKTNVSTKVSTVGSELTISDPVLFPKASSRILKKRRTQVRELAEDAKNAQGVIVIGHAAALSDSIFNFPISRNRATAVSSLMKRRKVTTPIVTVARGSSEPVTKKKTEKAQAQNRRVVVYLIP
jgi:outer membrane protein OmpA-like peptidoglycan-associated protein